MISLPSLFYQKPLISAGPAFASLGGLLVLRMEMQMLASRFFSTRKVILFSPDVLANKKHLIQEVFDDSFELDIFGHAEHNWPLQNQSVFPQGSSESIQRIAWLSRELDVQPLLRFPDQDIKRINEHMRQNSGIRIAVHLKQTSKESLESNANFITWGEFFTRYAIPRQRIFILLGHDAIDQRILDIPGVEHANHWFCSLKDQLALISHVDGFLGMASGVCQAAIFSNIPYVIFKHPLHHADEMQKELGSSIKFPFANKHQQIWRTIDTLPMLHKAYTTLGIEP